MRTVLLVPRRADGGQRDALWAWCRRRWERILPEATIYEGYHERAEGPFNRSAAINRAARTATLDGGWDLALVIDADVFLRESEVRAAIALALETGKVTWPHRHWRGLSQEGATELLAGELGAEFLGKALDPMVERTTPLSWSCCIAIPRAVFDDLGGFDERFQGWGWEDMAFQCLVCGLHGYNRLEGEVYHLWHARSDERRGKGTTNRAAASTELTTNALLGRRYMLALRRDHGLHDRPRTADAIEMARDIANLQADDVRWCAQARRRGLPDWSDWWPTLEELRDGAKSYNAGQRVPDPAAVDPQVILVVRTGGEPERWPERSAYLRESLASLAAQVDGPIRERILWSDWDHTCDAELTAMVEPYGFRLLGGGHQGYARSVQRLWRHLAAQSTPFVFSVEDDFLYLQRVDLLAMLETLTRHPEVAQIALLREPINEREEAEGTVLGWSRRSFEIEDGILKHRNFWTMNPSLFRRSICRQPWPIRRSSERAFGNLVLRDRKKRVAFWGDGRPWLHHIGEQRAADAY